MNRPFYAFGALAVILAVAVLAVSSTSRSTSVQPGSRRVLASQRTAKARIGGGVYLVRLPEAEPELASFPLVCGDELCYSQGCGLDRSTGEVYATGYSECLAYRRMHALRAATAQAAVATQVKPATFDATLSCRGDCRDCRSHYDALYDALVYGEGSEDSAEGSGFQRGVQRATNEQLDAAVVVRPSELEWEQCVFLFESLLHRPAHQPASGRSNAGSLERHLRNACSLWLGVQNAAERFLNQTGWLDDWQFAFQPTAGENSITWDDYAELIDRSEARSPVSAVRAESPSPVQSGRWMLRFAASGLESASQLLSTAASELNRAAGDVRLATQDGQSQR